MSERQTQGRATGEDGPDEARREFLKRCGKYAVATPPMVAIMLSAASKPAEARGLYGGQGGSLQGRLQSWLNNLLSKRNG
jgi:hypothetical protein